MKRQLLWKKAAAVIISAAMMTGVGTVGVGTAGVPVFAAIPAEESSIGIKEVVGMTAKAIGRISEERLFIKASQGGVGPGETQTETQAESQTSETGTDLQNQDQEVTESQVDAFFSGSVLVGDSVMMGYRNYCMRSTDPFLKSLSFLASGSFSVHNALWPVSSKSVHPLYQGAQRPVWESISMMQADKVFMFFGLNDLNMGNDTIQCYQQVVNHIKELSPDAQIYVISMTYTLRGKGKGKLNNDNIRLFNSQLQQLAADNGWGFVNLAPALADENGDLAPAYCSDNYVHQSRAAYEVWTAVLRQYARDQLKAASVPQA